jgi:hypothetical protein
LVGGLGWGYEDRRRYQGREGVVFPSFYVEEVDRVFFARGAVYEAFSVQREKQVGGADCEVYLGVEDLLVEEDGVAVAEGT